MFRAGVSALALVAAAWGAPAAPSDEAVCPAGAACGARAAAAEEAALLQVQGPNTWGQTTPAPSVQCTYSCTYCAGDQCCPRAPETGDKTYPCPSASDGWNDCETQGFVAITTTTTLPPAPKPPATCAVAQCGCTHACIAANNGGCVQGCGHTVSCQHPGCACAPKCYPPAGPGCPTGCGTNTLTDLDTCKVTQCGCAPACQGKGFGCVQGCGTSVSCDEPGCACEAHCMRTRVQGPGCPHGCGTNRLIFR